MTVEERTWEAWARRNGPWVCPVCDRLLTGPDAHCVACGDEDPVPVPLGHRGPVPERPQ